MEAPSSNIMPRLLRAFSALFIAFPGAIIWFYGALLCVYGSCSIFYRQEARNLWDDLAILALGASAVTLGYLMVIGTRILCGDSREIFAGFHFAERVIWCVAIQLLGILTASAALATLFLALAAEWQRVPLSLVLLLSFATASILLGRHWIRLRDTWTQEIIGARAARTRLHFHPPRNEDR
jgi:hypothetical protein